MLSLQDDGDCPVWIDISIETKIPLTSAFHNGSNFGEPPD